MGISINAKLIYGLPYSEIPEDIRDEVDELIDDGTLDYASPWYDSPCDDWIVGIEVCCDGLDAEGLKYASDDAYDDLPDCIRELDVGLFVSPDVS